MKDIFLNNVKYQCVIPKCSQKMEGDSPLCTHHLDNHEVYGHPYGKEVNERAGHLIRKGMERREAFQVLIESFKAKGKNKGLSYKRISHFHIALAQAVHEKYHGDEE